MSTPSVLIFGGSRGIGAACVEAFMKAGWQVGCTFATQKTPRPDVRGWQVDIRDPAAVARVFDEAAAAFGGAPRAVVANAGVNVPGKPVGDFSPDDFRLLMDVNLFGAYNVLAEAARRTPEGGAIIGVTTSLVRHVVPGTGPYSASKAAVESLLRAMSKELAPRRIRVNGVAPGPVDTDLFNAGKTEEVKQRMAAFSPLNRIGRPEEVANVVRFLASDEASWITGQIVQPNGGMI